MIYTQLCQLPPELLVTIATVSKKQAAEDMELETALLSALRQSRLVQRVPILVGSLKAEHNISTSNALRITALLLGLSYGYVRNTFYGKGI